MDSERRGTFPPPSSRDSRSHSRPVLPNGVPAHLPTAPATAYPSRSSYEPNQHSNRQSEPYSRWGNSDSRSASTSTLPPPAPRDSRRSGDSHRSSDRGRDEGRNRYDDSRRSDYDRKESRSQKSSSKDRRESRESDSNHGRSRMRYRNSEDQSPPPTQSSRHHSTSSSSNSNSQSQAQFYAQQIQQTRPGHGNSERSSYSRGSMASQDSSSSRDNYDRGSQSNLHTRAPLPPPRPGRDSSPKRSDRGSGTPSPPPSRNVKSTAIKSNSTLSKVAPPSSRTATRSRSRSPVRKNRAETKKSSSSSRRRSVSRTPISDSDSATSIKSFVRSGEDVEHSRKKQVEGGKSWDAVAEAKKLVEIEDHRKSKLKEMQEMETLDSRKGKQKETESTSNVPTGPRSLFGSRAREQVSITTSTAKFNSLKDVPTGPKNTVHPSRMKMVGIPTGPRATGGSNEQLKKFFPGDDSDDEKKQARNGEGSQQSSRSRTNGAVEGGRDNSRMDIDSPRPRHRTHGDTYSTSSLPSSNSGDSKSSQNDSRVPSAASNRYPSVRETLLRRPDSIRVSESVPVISSYATPSATPVKVADVIPISSTSEELASEPAPVELPPVIAPVELYERLVQVGEGTYGKVYKAKNTETGTLVALKRIRMEAEKDGFPVTAIREIKLLQSLRHPNVVDLIEMMVSRGHVYMVFEYMDHDLTGVLHHPSIHFSPAHLKSLMKQLLEGLGFIHRRGVLHRDLKGSNILLGKNGELKIADFGLARFYMKGRNNDYTNRVITQWYKPPELLFGATVYGAEVDMWSAGCIFLELFARRPVFQGQDEIHQLEVIFKATGTPSVDNWPKLQELPWYELVKPTTTLPSRFEELYSKWLTPGGLALVGQLLCLDPSGRTDSEQALRMDYFTSEEPKPQLPDMLLTVKGEWHEYESKRARKRQREEV